MWQRLTHGEQAALGELYDRFAPLVHALAHRVTADHDEATAVLREVFAEVWEHPEDYDPEGGPLRGWIAELAQRHAIRRLRRTAEAGEGERAVAEERVRAAAAAARADFIRAAMPPPLRDALDLAHHGRLDYHAIAGELGTTPDEARRRLRLGLQLISSALHTDPYEDPGGPNSRAAGAR
jgi:RNA polymerase sigma-70 factor (ECF subfamily)